MGVASCTNGVVDPTAETTLLSVTPSSGTTNVDPSMQISIEFSHPMRTDTFVALHKADMAGQFGPLVEGNWTWTQDKMGLMFTPKDPLE
jgi:hypothetical protein